MPIKNKRRNVLAYIHTAKVALACTILITACSDNKEDLAAQSQQHLKQARAYTEQGQLRPAMIEARNAIQKNPNDAAAQIMLAKIFLKLNQGKQALAQLDHIPEDQRNDANYIITKANALIGRGKYQSALSTLSSPIVENELEAKLLTAQSLSALGKADQAIDLYSSLPENNLEVRLGLAKAYAQKNDFHKTFELLEKLNADSPNNPKVLVFEAALAMRDGDLQKTENLLTSALSSLPNTDIMTPLKGSIMRGLSDVLIKEGRSSEALVYTKLLAEAYPGADLAEAKYKEAVELAQKGQLDEAKSQLLELMEDFPQFEQGAQMIGIISYLQGDYESANTYFNGNIDPETSNQLTTYIAARTSLKLNQPEKVLKLLGDSIADNTNPDTLALYGLAALAAGKNQEGEKTILRALDERPENSRLRLALADYYSRNNEQDKALKQAKAAFQDAAGKNDPLVQAQLAKQLLTMGKQKEANELVEEIVRNSPKNYTAYLVAADTKFQQNDVSAAEHYYKKALELEPNNSSALAGYGFASLRQEKWTQAQESFKKLAIATPNNILGYRGLLQTYYATKQKDAGVEAINELKNQNDSAMPFLALAEHFTRNKQFNLAKNEIQSAKEKFPDNRQLDQAEGMVAYYQATVALANDDLEEVKTIVLAGLKSDPNNQRLLIMLIEAETKLGNYTNATNLAKQLENENAQVYELALGEIDSAQDKNNTALAHYIKSWEIHPLDITGQKIYASHIAKQRKTEADSFAADWLEKLPNSPIALSVNADLALQNENYAEAISLLEKVLDIAPNSPITLNNLAWAYFKTDNTKAVETGQKAYELAQNNAAVVDTYGWILVNNKKVNQGIELLEKAAKLSPDTQEIQQHLVKAKSMR